ncbi:MAG: hypothetical protein V2A74_04810, partial [bacterium]
KMVVFLSTGNTCRAPMAAGYLRKLLDDQKIRNIEVRTAGVMTIAGLLATPESQQIMTAVGVDLSRHRSSQITPDVLKKADLILGMTPFHVQMALRMSDEAKGKTFLFKEYTRSDLKNTQIADPMGCTLEVYKKCFQEIKAGCDLLVKHPAITGKKPEPPPKPEKKVVVAKESKAVKKVAQAAKSKKKVAVKKPAKKAGGPKKKAAKAKAKTKARSSGKSRPRRSGRSGARAVKGKKTAAARSKASHSGARKSAR